MRTRFSSFNRICKNTKINDSSIGVFSYIGWNCILNNAKIGSFCSIAPFVEIIYGKHPFDLVSTHPIFYSNRKQCGISFLEKNIREEFTHIKDTGKSIVIKNDVWIGYGVKLIEGITIENGAVVLAGSVVTKDVDAYSIVGGVPAKHIKYRFNAEIREKLVQSKWWNKEIEWIKQNLEKYMNIDEFIVTIENDG